MPNLTDVTKQKKNKHGVDKLKLMKLVRDGVFDWADMFWFLLRC